MRRSTLLNLCLIMLLTTACNWVPQSSPPAPAAPPVAPTTAVGSAPAAAPAASATAPAAPATAPAAPAPGAPAPAPAVPAPAAVAATAPAAYQIQGTVDSQPVTMQVTELRRVSGNMLMLRFAIINNGPGDIKNVYAHSVVTDTYLVDPAGGKKYEVIRDTKFYPLASEMESTPFSQGMRRDVFAQYPAPPPTTTTVSIYFKGALPLMNVPITP